MFSGDRALLKPPPGMLGCRARTTSGQPTAAPPRSVKNSRRLILAPEAQDRGIVAVQVRVVKGCSVSVLGHKRTFSLQQPMSALPPIATLIAQFADLHHLQAESAAVLTDRMIAQDKTWCRYPSRMAHI